MTAAAACCCHRLRSTAGVPVEPQPATGYNGVTNKLTSHKGYAIVDCGGTSSRVARKVSVHAPLLVVIVDVLDDAPVVTHNITHECML